MAMAWITKVTNASTEVFTIRQNDPTWIPVSGTRQYTRDEPIKVYAMTPEGSPVKRLDPTWLGPWQGPPRLIDAVAEFDEIYSFPLQYCVIPWRGFGRLLLIADKTQKKITFEVGNFVRPGVDHLRGQLDDGTDIMMVELGAAGGAWISISYDFNLIISPNQGVRFSIEGISRSPVPDIVAGLSDALKTLGPKLLEALLR